MAEPLRKDLARHSTNSSPNHHEKPTYQAFQEINGNATRLRELLFFTRTVIFAISSLILAFIFLSFGLMPIVTFPLAIASSAGIIKFFNRKINHY